MTIIYSEKPLRERDKFDFYPTPIELCRASLKLLPNDFYPHEFLDPGCGTGVWGVALKERYPNAVLTGVDIRGIEPPDEYDLWFKADYLNFNRRLAVEYDLVIGNPPYKFVEEFLNKSLSSTIKSGYVLFLLRLSFLESKKRFDSYFNNKLNPWKVAVSTRRVSFTGNKKSDNTAYAIFIWKKDWVGSTELTWLDWNYDDK